MGSKRPKDSQLLTLSKLIEATYHEQGKLPPSQHNAFYNASSTLVMDIDYLLESEDLPLTVSIVWMINSSSCAISVNVMLSLIIHLSGSTTDTVSPTPCKSDLT